MKEKIRKYIDKEFYEAQFGVDLVAEEMLPDFQRAVVKASTVINLQCSNRIDDPGLEHLSDQPQF